MDKNSKAIIGVGVLAAAYFMLSSSNSEDVGGSGNFGGLGSGGIEELSGQTDSGIPYNISFPAIDPSPIFSIMNEPAKTGGTAVVTSDAKTPIKTKKESVVSSNIQEQDGSLASSLAQVFGTQAQKTNERGDYYTTSAGGGAGAGKGKSLGEMFIDTAKKVTSSKGVDTKIYTGASTASQKTIGDIDVKSVLQSDATKKASQMEAIKDTKIASPVKIINPLQELKDSGIVKSSSGSSKSITTTKKSASSSSSSSGIKSQGGSGTGESRVKIVRKN